MVGFGHYSKFTYCWVSVGAGGGLLELSLMPGLGAFLWLTTSCSWLVDQISWQALRWFLSGPLDHLGSQAW